MPISREALFLMTPLERAALRLRMKALARKGGAAMKRRAASEQGYYAEIGRMGGMETARQARLREVDS